MIYKFRSKAAGDVIMLGPHGDALLRAIGRTPAATGIIEPAALADALSGIERAIAEDDAARAAAQRQAAGSGSPLPESEAISARRRLWPMQEMLRRAQAAAEAVVWGV